MIRSVFTCGDTNGIGPEIAIKTFNKLFLRKIKNPILFICPKNVFEFYYKLTKSKFDYRIIEDQNKISASHLNLIPLPNVKTSLGKITAQAGKTSYQSIIKAIDFIKNNQADVMVTPPISKEAINKSGIDFIGHTELLAGSEKTKKYLMMFLSNNVKAVLLTIHEPIKNISSLLSKKKIISAIETMYLSAVKDFGILDPRIAVMGLNPHAGENGLIGKEEVKIISPVINKLKSKFNIDGPFVPDAFWGNKIYKNYDMILGMYHDQVLIPFKLLHFNSGVNFTAGLKIIRTSPDHGTAFDIAGKNIADPSSLMQSYNSALKIYRNRKNYFANIAKH